jgi:hypothetical protein
MELQVIKNAGLLSSMIFLVICAFAQKQINCIVATKISELLVHHVLLHYPPLILHFIFLRVCLIKN